MKKKVASKSEISPNSMHPVSVDDKEILLVHTDKGNYYAVDIDCPHEGAPLYTGLLLKDKIICPWHHACFDCKNGKVIEPPALSDLKSYKVTVKDEDLYLDIPDKDESSDSKENIENLNDNETFIIIGAGASGRIAADTMRKEGFKGKIKMISDDTKYPYDRTALSKDYLKEKLNQADILLQKDSYFEEHSIELMTGLKVSSLDTLTHTITLDDGKNLIYDKLLIATGSKPVIPYIPGSELKNIFTLRTIDDANDIIKKAKESENCVIIGSSFIALEAASFLREYDLDIKIVSKDKIPFEHILGRDLGKFLMNVHKDNGVEFILENEPVRFTGNEYVDKIELSDGKSLNADFVLIGIGVKPSTDFIKGKTLDDGSLNVDEYLMLTKDVYAAGDVASYPDHKDGRRIRIEHWRTAQQQGKTAAMNMLDKKQKFRAVPFFQTTQLGQNIQYIGHVKNWDRVIIDGEIKKNDFLVYYLKDGIIKAVAAAGKDEEIMILEELFISNKINDIKDLPIGLKDMKRLL